MSIRRWIVLVASVSVGVALSLVPVGGALAGSAGAGRDLGTLGGAASRAVGVNAFGVVVGTSDTAAGTEHAFVWTASHGMRDLGTLGGASSSAVAVNDLGWVAGTAQTTAGTEHAFVWTASHGMRDLGTLGGATSRAVALNAFGQVVGDSTTTSQVSHVFRWTPGAGMQDIAGATGINPTAVDINAAGQVLGNDTLDSFVPRAFIWSPRLGSRDLGDLGANYHTVAADLNDLGQVVGYSWVTGGGSYHAFLWNPVSRTMRDLGVGESDAVPCYFSDAAAINNRGQIAGRRVDDDGANFCSGLFWGRGSTAGRDIAIEPVAINAVGLVLGNSPSSGDSPPADHAFTWNAATGTTTDLGTGHATALNRRGDVVGQAPSTSGPLHATLWHVSCAS